MKKLTTKEFIDKAKKVHGDKYDYSKVEYVNNRTKVCIICPIHGEFWQLPSFHVMGCDCPKCKGKYMTKEEFSRKANLIYKNKYDYSKVEYVNNRTKVCIICPIHGEFWMTPSNHLSNHGCPKCKSEKTIEMLSSTTKEFIDKAKKVHGYKYDYSKVEYVNNHTPVCIICPIHGEFWQTPNSHLKGSGCFKCVKKIYDKNSFIEKARRIHGDKYDYSKVEYKNSQEKVCIICPEHGEFWQTPDAHVNMNQGCPICRESKLEKEIRLFLNENNIKHTQRKKFEWLKKKNYLHYDFFLNDYNIAIECQGIQHYKPIKYFGGEKQLSKQKEYDLFKKIKSKEHNIKILYYSDKKYSDEIIIDKNNILKYII